MADIIWVSFPICLHLREEVGLVDALRFADCSLDRVTFLRVELAVVRPVESIETGCDSSYRFIFRAIVFVQRLDGLSFEKR